MARTHTASEIVQSVQLSQVYSALTGEQPRSSGNQRQRYRVAATWREGDGLNVSLDDSTGRWRDYKTDERGGVLDLITHVRGGTRKEALGWLSDYTGLPLTQQSQQQKQDWREQRVALERDLPDAQLWKHSAVSMGDDELARLKRFLVDPAAPSPAPGQVAALTSRVDRWRELDGAPLVEEYQRWRKIDPATTQQMVDVARAEKRELEWLLATQTVFADDLRNTPDRVVNEKTGRTYHDEVRLGLNDMTVEEALLREENKSVSYERQNLKPPSEMNNQQIVAETKDLHERFATLTEQFREGQPAQKAAVVREMEEIARREQELRKAYTAPAPELAQDRVPQEVGMGYSR